MADIFLSDNEKDRDTVRRLAETLKRRGLVLALMVVGGSYATFGRRDAPDALHRRVEFAGIDSGKA